VFAENSLRLCVVIDVDVVRRRSRILLEFLVIVGFVVVVPAAENPVERTFYLDSILTPVFTLFSRCPVLNVPSGFAANGVPTGIQIVGRTYDDLTAFRIGAASERARRWLDRPERRPSAGGVSRTPAR
jgi:Asp-tRNA(Asn)/Glu-tRNA(Gln) amidotransferase A subunit family amidase